MTMRLRSRYLKRLMMKLKNRLGEYNEVTCDYATQLELARIGRDKLNASITNNRHDLEAAAIQAVNEEIVKAQQGYDNRVTAAENAQKKEEEAAKQTFEATKKYYDDMVTTAKETYDSIASAAQNQKDAKVSALQSQLDEIDKAEQEKDRKATKLELENNIKKAHGSKERAKAQAALDAWLYQEDIRIQKEDLQVRIKAAQDEYDTKIRIAKSALTEAEQTANINLSVAQGSYDNQLAAAQKHYNNALSAANSFYTAMGLSIDATTGKLNTQKSKAIIDLMTQANMPVTPATPVTPGTPETPTPGGGSGTTPPRTPYKTISTTSSDVINRGGSWYAGRNVWESLGYSVGWDQANQKNDSSRAILRHLY